MGRQTCQPDFVRQFSGTPENDNEVVVEEYKEIDRVKDIHKYQKTKLAKPSGPLVKEKEAFKVPEILTKGATGSGQQHHLQQISHFKKIRLTEMDKNSVSKISTFSIDSNSSTLSLRLIGK